MKKPIPFGKYYLLDRINVGGMAEVFKAKAFGVEGFERLIAVKRILPNIAEDEEFIAMFIDEAKIAVQLQHANIAQIFDLGKVDDSYFIALEYVRGRDLRAIFDRLRSKSEVMALAQACHIVMQICEGLDYAHNKRDGQGRELHLVHRDISPQNVLVGFDGEIKLIDFGIAKAAGKASKTQAGILKGKFGYMSPEQVRGLPIDRRSDIFSVGIILYELLTGERLFIGESDFSTLEKVRNVDIVPPSSYNKSIPPELERIALKALAKVPEDRYQNAIDLHDDLQAFMHSKSEMYSRKDLGAWMKKMFAPEIEDENAKMEQYRQVGAPVAAPVSPRRTMMGVGVGPMPGASASSGTGSRRSPAAEELNWDDEELDTQIFEKENTAEPELLEARDIFEDDEDRTVANEPPPDILRAATAPELATPQPRLPSRPGITPVGTPTDGRSGLTGSGRMGPPMGAPRQSLLGLSAPSLPAPSVTGRTLPTASPAPGSLMRSSRMNMPVPPHLAPPPTQSFEVPMAGPPARRSRMGLMVVVLLLVVGAVAGGGYYWSISRAGKVEISTVPADATILVDNVKVADKSPYTLDRPPGPYTVAVVRPGYVRNEQSVQVRSGQTMALSVTLEAAPDTGFELTSEPPGGLVWLDGNPMSGPDGQARTDFRAYRIPPGKHVLEIRGDPKYQPWRQEVDIEPGKIMPVKATLVPVGGTEAKTPPAPSPTPTGGPVVAQLPTTPAPTPTTPAHRRRAIVRESGGDDSSPTPTRTRSSGGDDSASTSSSGSSRGGDCSLTVGTRPWAELWIDGKNTGRHTPYIGESISCGKHKLTFKRQDLGLERTENITIRPGEKFKQSFTLDEGSE